MRKTLTIDLPEDVYTRAEHRAAQQGDTLPAKVVKLVEQYSECEPAANVNHTPETDSFRLLAALNRGRNTTPVGRLNREELYDRAVLR